MSEGENVQLTEMGAKVFQDLIRNKKNLLSVFTLKGKFKKVIIFHQRNFKPWIF
jgi:hypothetical protein